MSIDNKVAQEAIEKLNRQLRKSFWHTRYAFVTLYTYEKEAPINVNAVYKGPLSFFMTYGPKPAQKYVEKNIPKEITHKGQTFPVQFNGFTSTRIFYGGI